MSKSLKKLSVITLLIATLVLFLSAAFLTYTVHADSVMSITGVSIRPVLNENGNLGIRYVATVTNADNSRVYGIEIGPADLIDASVEEQAIGATQTGYASVISGQVIVALNDIKTANMSRPFMARPVEATYSNGEYTIVKRGEWSEPVSIYTVATQTLADKSANIANIKDDLEMVVSTVHGATTLTGAYQLGEIEITSTNSEYAINGAIKYGDVLTVNANVVKGNKSLKAYPNVKVLNSSDEDVTADVLVQVAGTTDKYEVVWHGEDLRIVCEIGSSDCAITKTFEECDFVKEVELYQLMPWGDASSMPLMESYVIRTKNDKIIVVDGGILKDEYPYINDVYLPYAIRSALGLGQDEYFEVDAWILSHAHADHYYELAKMLNSYDANSNYKINDIIFDFPSNEWLVNHDFSAEKFSVLISGLNNYADVNNITINSSTGNWYDDLNGSYVNATAIENGLTKYIDGVRFDFLLTYDESSDKNVNDNSMIFKVTVNEGKTDEQTVLFLNDADVASGARLLTTYKDNISIIDSDIVQLAHHGQAGVTKEVYQYVTPGAQLWSAPKWIWSTSTTDNYRTEETLGWFGLGLDLSNDPQNIVACLYDAYPSNPTLVSDWNNCIDGMMIKLPYSGVGSCTLVPDEMWEESAIEGVDNAYGYNATNINVNGDVTSVTLPQGEIIKNNYVINPQGNSDTLAYYGLTDGFGVNKTLSINFTGKNLPGLGLFLSPESGANYVIGGATNAGTGLFLQNGIVNKGVGGRLIANGPYRLDSGNPNDYSNAYEDVPYNNRINDLSYWGDQNATGYPNVAEMGYINLDESKDYRLDVSALLNGNVLTMIYTLYGVNGETLTEICNVSKSLGITNMYLNKIDFTSTKIGFYGSIYEDITFSFSVSDYVVPPVKTYKATVNGNTVTMEGGAYTQSSTSYTTDYAYHSVGKFGLGKSIVITYKGMNMPNLAIFTDSEEGQAIGGGEGYFIQTSNPSVGLSARNYVIGPYRLDCGNNSHSSHASGSYKYGYIGGENDVLFKDHPNRVTSSYWNGEEATSPISYVMASDANTYYRYTVSALEKDASNFTLIIMLESATSENGVYGIVRTLNYTVSKFSLDFSTERYAIIYGALCNAISDNSITFDYKVIDYVPASSYMATVSGSTITLAGGTSDHSETRGSCYTDIAYHGLGTYEVGDRLTFTFKGANIPNLALFTDTEYGQAIGGGTGFYISNCNRNYNLSKQVRIHGPNRLEKGDGTQSNGSNYNNGVGYNDVLAQELGENIFGLASLNADLYYRYTVTTAQAANGYILYLTLESSIADDGVYETTVGTIERTISTSYDLTGRYAMVYGVDFSSQTDWSSFSEDITFTVTKG